LAHHIAPETCSSLLSHGDFGTFSALTNENGSKALEKLCLDVAAANQDGDAFGEGAAANNQAAQAIDQGSLFGGGINQGQAGEWQQILVQRTHDAEEKR
jgi:hypothetical protein